MLANRVSARLNRGGFVSHGKSGYYKSIKGNEMKIGSVF